MNEAILETILFWSNHLLFILITPGDFSFKSLYQFLILFFSYPINVSSSPMKQWSSRVNMVPCDITRIHEKYTIRYF